MKITVIGGGNMGGAVAYGAIAKAVVAAEDVTISHLDPKMDRFFEPYKGKFIIEDDNAKSIEGADLIIVAVKPWLMEEVLGEISSSIDRSKQALVSIAAGITFEQLSSFLSCNEKGALALYRVIPNTAISIGQSVTMVCKNGTTQAQDNQLLSILNSLGSTFEIGEDMMGAYTSLSSCGIAFAYRYMDAAMKGGIEEGLDQKTSLEVVLQTVRGALMMLETNGTLPQEETDKVTTKGGITLKGLEAMEKGGFSAAVIDGIKYSK